MVGEFNRVQQENDKGGCSNGSASNWLNRHRPIVAICPHKLDYCDTCAKFNEDIHANQTTLNRLKQTGSSSEEELKSLESDIQELHTDPQCRLSNVKTNTKLGYVTSAR